MPEKCDGCGKRFSTDHALICMKGGLVGWGHNQFRDVMGEFSQKACYNYIWEPVVREASQRARDGGSDGLTAGFVVRGVWEPDRDCLFDTRIIHAGSPGRATQHICCQGGFTRGCNPVDGKAFFIALYDELVEHDNPFQKIDPWNDWLVQLESGVLEVRQQQKY